MATLANIQSAFKHALQDTSGLLESIDGSSTNVRDRLIGETIKDYSKRLPQVKVADIAPVALSVNSNIFSVPSDFTVSGTSSMINIEYPIDKVPPSYLERKRHWDISNAPAGLRIWFRTAPTDTYRLRYTLFHASNASTIPARDEELVGKWAAAKALQYFADRYSQSRDATLTVDSSDPKGKGDILQRRYESLMAEVDMMLRSLELAWIMDNNHWTKFTSYRV